MMTQLIRLVCMLSVVAVLAGAAPCEINSESGMNTARIEFNENTPVGSVLYTFPFDGTQAEIDSIAIRSGDLGEQTLDKYFDIKYKSLILSSHYDLSEQELDFVELLVTCLPRTNNSSTAHQLSINDEKNTFLLYITINDVNDKSPEFLDTPYSFKLKELTPVGTTVYQSVRAIDRDVPNRPNSQITFSIEKGPCSDYFEFPLTTKSEIAVAKLIHYDALAECNLTIKATDHGQPALSSFVSVAIQVVDIDDKDPVFTSSFYKGFLARSSSSGTLVNMTSSPVKAYDQDTGINMTLKYSLNNNPEGLFEINEETGVIKLVGQILDYDIYEYNLVVRAVQTDNALRTAMSMVNVNILDLNEHAPRFDSRSYSASITENSPLDQIVTKEVRASDADKNRVEYSIVNNHEAPFVIDKYTGVIKVNGRLDYEMKSSYDLELVASDGKYADKVSLKISIINLIDKAPHFEYNYYSFKIKIPYDVYVGQIRATDVENTGNMSYAIRFNDLNDSNLFCITQTGTIYLCSSVITPSSPLVSDARSVNTTQPKFNNIDELVSQFDKESYEFNVTVSIYSPDLLQNLENHVECKIQIEPSKQLPAISGLATPRPVRPSSLMPVLFMPSTPIESGMFKNASTIYYVLIGIIAATLIILLFCASVFMWFKCRKHVGSPRRSSSSSLIKKRHHPTMGSSNSSSGTGSMTGDEEIHKISGTITSLNLASRMPFELTTAACKEKSSCTNSNCSHVDEHRHHHHHHHHRHHNHNVSSSKNSTSSGVSCSSACSNCSKLSSNKRSSGLLDQHLFYSNWPERIVNEMMVTPQTASNMIHRLTPNNNQSNSSPISKVTTLSEYMLTNENETEDSQAIVKSSNILKLAINNPRSPPATYANYTDILSHTATSLMKSHETPILIRPPEYNMMATTSSMYDQGAEECYSSELGCVNKAYTTFKRPTSSSISPPKSNNSLLTTTAGQSVDDPDHPSPQLLSFMPPPLVATGRVSEYLTPKDLAVNNTSMLYNQQEPLVVHSETNLNNEIIKKVPESEAKFHDHIENCNTSLVKLVNIIEKGRNNSKESMLSSSSSRRIDHGEEEDELDYMSYDDHQQSQNQQNETREEDLSFSCDLSETVDCCSSYNRDYSTSQRLIDSCLESDNRRAYRLYFSSRSGADELEEAHEEEVETHSMATIKTSTLCLDQTASVVDPYSMYEYDDYEQCSYV